MLIVISPAKTLNFDKQKLVGTFSQPDFIIESKKLIKELRLLMPNDISNLMNISPKLAYLNFERFQQWATPLNIDNAKQALLAFRGEVFTGINADSFTKSDFEYSQSHLRILSGLYGVLKPLDLISAYRLEMGTKLPIGKNRNLYEFWNDKITKSINTAVAEQNDDVLINLASNEYFKSLKQKNLKAKVITPIFKDAKNDEYKVISFYAKKARGLMTAFIIKNRINNPNEIKLFDAEGYFYNDELSKEDMPVFTRG